MAGRIASMTTRRRPSTGRSRGSTEATSIPMFRRVVFQGRRVKLVLELGSDHQRRTDAVRTALGLLGIDRLVLAIHDQSFPSTLDEDVGRGSPYGLGARALLELLAALGFDGVQLGPQGDTS